MGRVPEIDVVDMTWIGAERAAVAAWLAQPAQWPHWWPDLELVVTEWRGALGLRWDVPSARRGRAAGSMEIYLHPADDGVVAYYLLRLDGTRRALPAWQRARWIRAYRARAKRVFWAIGDRVDPGRVARVAAPSPDPRR